MGRKCSCCRLRIRSAPCLILFYYGDTRDATLWRGSRLFPKLSSRASGLHFSSDLSPTFRLMLSRRFSALRPSGESSYKGLFPAFWALPPASQCSISSRARNLPNSSRLSSRGSGRPKSSCLPRTNCNQPLISRPFLLESSKCLYLEG